ncbi:MAG: efflux RND transporter periplasmic adaptor subunit [Nitrospinaceae bacterium]
MVFKDVADEIRTVGNILAEQRVRINAEVEGQVTRMPVREGGRVRAGDLIAQVDPREYQLEVERLEAEQVRAEKAYEKSLSGARPEERERLQAKVKADESALDLALKEQKRFADLLQEGVISQSIFDAAADRVRRSQEQLRSSRAEWEGAQRGREEDIAQAGAALKSAQRRLSIAELNLEKTALRAPFDGVIVARRVEAGRYVKAGDPVAEMISSATVKAELELPQAYRGRLQELDGILFKVPELDLQFAVSRRQSRKLRVIPDADIYSGNIRAQLDLDQAPAELFPGLTLEARLRFKVRRGVKHVPAVALVIGEKGMVVYTVKEGKAHMAPVRAQLEREGLVEIDDFTHQLGADARVILRGSGAVFPGAPVRITNPPESGEPGLDAAKKSGGAKGPPGPKAG